jgi:long-subunit acyl-CoA synthetase (AMP-forming)
VDDLPPTAVGLLASRVEHFPQRVFASIARLGKLGTIDRWTYLEAGRRIAGLADWLTDYGLRKGDRIATYMDLGDPGIWLTLACAANGVIPVPLGPSYSIDALGQLATQCRAKAIFTMPELVGKVKTLGLPVLCIPRPDEIVPAGGITIGEKTPADPVARLKQLAAAAGPDDIYMFQPTSGSTGVPKMVMRRNITFPRAGKVLAAGLTTEDGANQAGLLAQAFTHGSGHYCIEVLMYLAAEICIPSAIDTDISLAEVEHLNPTYLYLAPRILKSLFAQHNAYKDAANVPFCGNRLQWITIGGAPSDESHLSELERRKVQVVEGYGATEISVIAVTVRGERRPGAVGRVLPDIVVRTGGEGEIEVKSAFGMAGYFEAEELSRNAFTEDGFYKTGDLGTIDAEGFLRLHGRSRDVFNSAEGSNIYPTRIETMLEGLPSVSQALLVGDGKPFITALLSVKDGPSKSTEPLSPKTHAELYARVRAEIATINPKLEAFERVRRFALFGGPFPESVYQHVGHSKIKRERKQTVALYRALVEELYAASSPYELA